MQIPWTARKTSKWEIDQLKPELNQKAKMLKLRVSYFQHIIRRQDSLEKTMLLGKVDDYQEKRETKYKMDWLIEGRCRIEFASAEQGC